MDRILYHYTDFIAMDGILQGKELRLNNVLNMNDAEEMKLFLQGIFGAVYDRLINAGEKDKALKVQEQINEQYKKRFEYSAYAACFSSYRDDAAQWERYANRGKGVCLAVRREILGKIIGSSISLQEVYYEKDLKSHPFVEEIYNQIKTSDDLTMNNSQLWESIRQAWRNSASFKHPSFSSEHEMRLVVMPFGAEDFDVKPRYHVSNERIKKYYPLDLEAMCSQAGVTMEDLVSEIMIGPLSSQSLPILQDYLRDLSLNALAERVVLSECPLQNKL